MGAYVKRMGGAERMGTCIGMYNEKDSLFSFLKNKKKLGLVCTTLIQERKQNKTKKKNIIR